MQQPPAARASSSNAAISQPTRNLRDLPPLARYHLEQMEEDALALAQPPPPIVIRSGVNVEEDEEGDDDWNVSTPPCSSPRPPMFRFNDWEDDAQAIELAYQSLARGRGGASSTLRRSPVEERVQRRAVSTRRCPLATRRSDRLTEDDFVRFADRQDVSANRNRSRSPLRAAQRRRMIDEFAEFAPSSLAPLQRICFSQRTLRHDLAFVPIGMYVYVSELSRRVPVIVDMRPTGVDIASFALFQNSHAQIIDLPSPRCEVANYMLQPYTTPIARHGAVIHVADRHVSFPVRVLLTQDWTQDRLVLSSATLAECMLDVDMSCQRLLLRYSTSHSASHDFYSHTSILEQASNPTARRAGEDLVEANAAALREERNHRRNR